ncbi:MAG TPA: very short patch repair endonuclease [Noviherbaspirillum sp.]|nr:very short patch repair endonuclease [Noviherbaspirillum sp.]
MTDVFSPKKRSEVMSAIRSKNTKPEIRVRSELHRKGYRFRLHVKDLPGKPDLVLPRYCTAIQVRGCFWHGHTCSDGHLPKSRQEYWIPKLEKNKLRDSQRDTELRNLGWSVLVIWECECSEANIKKTIDRITDHLEKQNTSV